MKKILFICLIVLVGAFVSCTKQRDSYYVKYEVTAIDSHNYGTSANIEVLTNDSIVSKVIQGLFEEIYGPYKYHDNTYLKIQCNHGHYSWNTTGITGKIYVSKNGEPFVLKAEIETALGGDSFLHPDVCEISYIIDF